MSGKKIDEAKRHKNVATTAIELVHGDRNQDYGHPEDNHGRTQRLWNAYLKDKLSAPLSMRDVCMLNVLQKVSRDANRPKSDNLVDIVGWSLNAEIVSEAEDQDKET
jgi:hypothetical protein